MDEVTTRPAHCKDRAKHNATQAGTDSRVPSAEPALPDFQSEREQTLQVTDYAVLAGRIAGIRKATRELHSLLALSDDTTTRRGDSSDYRALMIATQKAMALMFGSIQTSVGDLYKAAAAQTVGTCVIGGLGRCDDAAVDVDNALLAMAALAGLRVSKDSRYLRQMEASHLALSNAVKRFDLEITALRRSFNQKAGA